MVIVLTKKYEGERRIDRKRKKEETFLFTDCLIDECSGESESGVEEVLAYAEYIRFPPTIG